MRDEDRITHAEALSKMRPLTLKVVAVELFNFDYWGVPHEHHPHAQMYYMKFNVRDRLDLRIYDSHAPRWVSEHGHMMRKVWDKTQ